MLEIKNLLTRKTVKNFLPEKIDSEILQSALRVAHRAPTSLNCRSVILLEISKWKNADWLSGQLAPRSAPHLFLFAFNPEIGELNARKFLAGRYGTEIGETKVNETFARIAENKEEWARKQIYLVAGYFAATLEAAGVQGCFIGAFDKKKVQLPPGYQAELIFACGHQDPQNPGTTKTGFARSFEEFYYPEQN